MPMGYSTLLFRTKGKLMSLFDDIDDKPSHPQRDSTLRFFKRTNEEGNSVIVVSLTSSSSNSLIFP